MTPEDHIRILRAAAHWARGLSNEFGLHCDATPNLAVTRAHGGAITLTGTTTTHGTLSICLTADEVRLARHELLDEGGAKGVRTVEVILTLPRYLAAQLRRPDTPPSDPQPELVPA